MEISCACVRLRVCVCVCLCACECVYSVYVNVCLCPSGVVGRLSVFQSREPELRIILVPFRNLRNFVQFTLLQFTHFINGCLITDSGVIMRPNITAWLNPCHENRDGIVVCMFARR